MLFGPSVVSVTLAFQYGDGFSGVIVPGARAVTGTGRRCNGSFNVTYDSIIVTLVGEVGDR